MKARFEVLQLDCRPEQAPELALARLAESCPSVVLCCGQYQQIHRLAAICPAGLPLLGMSSCQSCASSGTSPHSQHVLHLFVIHDSAGHYGIATCELTGENLKQQIGKSVEQAALRAGRCGETPALVWCMQPPGQEEQIIDAIQHQLGPQVPIIGGSAADDDVNGQWCLFAEGRVTQNRLLLLLMYPTVAHSFFFSSGYHRLALSATVTAASGRLLQQLNNRPALEVYNEWRLAAGFRALDPSAVLNQTTLTPFGRAIAEKPIPLTLLSHPIAVTADGSIELLSEVQVGDKLMLMQGSEQGLIRRAAYVVNTALEGLEMQGITKPAAALIIYCAGCMLAVRSQYAEIQHSVQRALGDVPYLMAYTFGEQGCFADGSNRHGNLMISALLFGDEHD